MGKSVIIFRPDTSTSVHTANKNKYSLILSEVPTKGLDDTKLTAEAKYPINFTQSGKRVVLSRHTMEATVSYLLMQQKYMFR